MPVRTSLVVAWAVLGFLSPVAAAQRPRDVVIRIRVVDSANVPVGAADVSIVKGLQDVVGAGATDDAGVRLLTVPRRDGDYQVVVRKIGYQRAERFFAAPTGDSAAFQVVLHRSVQTLQPVNVTAAEDVKRKSYHADADDIANSSRPVLDGLDIFSKLRPDMLYSRAGGAVNHCTIEEVWINDRRVSFGYADTFDLALKKRRTSMYRPRGSSQVPLNVLAILISLKPEHIAEINYHDCMDFSVGKNGDHNAAFVVLKPGIDFAPGRGSFVAESPRRVAIARADTVAARPLAADSVPEYRRRLLGVFDEATGDPVAGVDVIDVSSGTKAVTTVTGTVALTYLPDGVQSVRLHKAGYRDVTIEVTISPGVTAPITSVLVPAPDDRPTKEAWPL